MQTVYLIKPLAFMASAVALVAALGISPAASADTAVVPGAFANTPGTTGTNTLVRDANAPRTYQMIIDDGQLASIPVGSLITGVQWRASISANNPPIWPAADYHFNDYNMWLAPAALPVGSMSTTFADNVGPGEMQVFDGPLTISANTFVNNNIPGLPNPWGFLINFTSGYIYTGGDLVFTARHPGANEIGTLFLDAINNTVSVANGVQTVSATSGDTATTGVLAASTIMQFTYTAVPAPSALALFGLGFLGIGHRRR